MASTICSIAFAFIARASTSQYHTIFIFTSSNRGRILTFRIAIQHIYIKLDVYSISTKNSVSDSICNANNILKQGASRLVVFGCKKWLF